MTVTSKKIRIGIGGAFLTGKIRIGDYQLIFCSVSSKVLVHALVANDHCCRGTITTAAVARRLKADECLAFPRLFKPHLQFEKSMAGG